MLSREQRRENERLAKADADRKAEFVAKMKAAKEAKLKDKLLNERGVRVVAFPTPAAIAAAQAAVKRSQDRMRGRV